MQVYALVSSPQRQSMQHVHTHVNQEFVASDGWVMMNDE